MSAKQNIGEHSRGDLMRYTEINAQTIDRWNQEGWEWGVPIDHDAFARAQKGEWSVLLTPTKPVPTHWFGELRGKRLLGLASGGGQQMPLFTAAGAICTVLDYSLSQLDNERMVAQREGYQIDIVHADMTKPLPFPDESFDLIFHPVSNCYIEDVESVWRECARILRKGGRLLVGFDNGLNFIFNEEETVMEHTLPFNPLKNETLLQECMASNMGVQFSHTISEQIGGQLRAGLRLADIYEDTNGRGRLHEHGAACYYATLAYKE